MKFTVIKDKWIRGSSRISLLLNEQGCRCCIGYVCQACGIPDNKLLGYSSVWMDSVYSDFLIDRKELEKLKPVFGEWTWEREAYEINDDANISDDERMKKLIELFARHGHEIEFI